MTKELSEDTSFKVSIKTLAAITGAVAWIVGYHYYLMGEIEDAKSQPHIGRGVYSVDPGDPSALKTYPPSRLEYDMKDELARKEISILAKELEELRKKLETK